MPLLVTNAAGANGDGYGALFAFDDEGAPLSAFRIDHRIADPRGLGVDRDRRLLFVNSGSDRVLVLDPADRIGRRGAPTVNQAMIMPPSHWMF